ncbi:MAG: hypothetical protein IJA67_00860 [Oscillospiraceae bacterium]|nr:hypothetical protein [Oscillospiraceae bacterium]
MESRLKLRIAVGLLQIFHLQQPSHKIFDFVAYIDWFQGIRCPEMAVFDRQNQYPRADALQMRQPFMRLILKIRR